MKTRKFALAAALAASLAAVCQPSTRIVAHRGEHINGATENSLAALRNAMNSNYYGIELDTWITADNEIVVHHDGKVDSLAFENCTYSQIKDLTLANGEPIPTFDAFLAAYLDGMGRSDTKLIVEIKSHTLDERNNACVDKVMQKIHAAGLEDRTEYIAFSLANCRRIVANDSTTIVGYLTGDLTPAEVNNLGIRSIDYHYSHFNKHPEWIAEAHDLGMIVNAWTVNRPAEMLKLISNGVDYITTDDPATASRVAAGQSPESPE